MYIKENDGKLRVVNSTSDKVLQNITPGVYEVEVQRSFFGKEIFFKPNTNFEKNKASEGGVFEELTTL